MVDWNQVAQALLDGMAWGIGFVIPLVIGLAILFLSILVHPTVTRIARAADRIGKKVDEGGGFLGQIVDFVTGK